MFRLAMEDYIYGNRRASQMKLKKTKFASEKILNYIEITAGVVIITLSLNLFLVPNKIAPGGLSGLATLLHYTINVPVGASMAILNIPLFVLGFRKLGTSFALRSFYGMLLLSLLLDIMKLPTATDDLFLASIYGTVLLGIGLGLAMRGGGSTGGSDMFAKILHAYRPNTPVGTYMIAFDLFIVVGAGILFSPKLGMYALVVLYGSAKVLDVSLQGTKSSRACMIISDKKDYIGKRIINELERGATLFKAVGVYSGKDKDAMLCIVQSSAEMHQLKKLVKESDPDAFMIVSDVNEVLGQGFSSEK